MRHDDAAVGDKKQGPCLTSKLTPYNPQHTHSTLTRDSDTSLSMSQEVASRQLLPYPLPRGLLFSLKHDDAWALK